MNTTPEQIADLTKAHTSAHQDLLNFASSIQTRMTKLETDLQERTTQLETALQSQFIVAAPVGSLIVHAAQTPPSGWFECNGATKSRTDYADLFNTIGTAYGEGDGSTTFNLPDLRGEFVRGWSHDRTDVDSGRVLGSWQHGSHIPHDTDSANAHTIPTAESAIAHQLEPPTLTTGISQMWAALQGSNNQTPNTYYSSVKPRNLALMYCIKF